MLILQGQNLSRTFQGDILFEQLNIQIKQYSRVALVGRNGSGKSTLLKMLAGIEKSDSGQVTYAKDISIGYLDQHSAVDTTNTIWGEMASVFQDVIAWHDQLQQLSTQLSQEHVINDTTLYEKVLTQYETIQHQLEQSNGYTYEADIKSVLFGFQFTQDDFNRSISELSGGQKTRLAMAKMLLTSHDLLILDEPTNHLDIDTLTWLENYLSHYKGALLIVSHDRYFLDKVVNEVYELSHHKIEHYVGNYSTYLVEKEKRLETLWKQYDKQQTLIAKTEEFIAKNIVRSSTTKRAQSRRKLLEKMQRIEKPKGDEKVATFHFNTEKESGNVVLQTKNLAIGYSEHVLSSPINLDIRKQQAIAIIGPNGIGKTTLLKTLLQQLPAISGNFRFGTNVTVGYYDQQQENLPAHKDVLHTLWDEHPNVNEKDIRSILGTFLFTQDDVLKPTAILSGGERARLRLSQLAMQKSNFLILDEPTNHLDLDSKEVLENALIGYDGTLLFISHDRYFINRIATQIVEITPSGSQFYLGDYDYYLEKKANQQQVDAVTKPKEISDQQKQYKQTKEEQRTLRQLERHLQQLEDDMSHLEHTIKELETLLTQDHIFSNHEKSLQITQQLESIRQDYDTHLQKWEEVSLSLENF